MLSPTRWPHWVTARTSSDTPAQNSRKKKKKNVKMIPNIQQHLLTAVKPCVNLVLNDKKKRILLFLLFYILISSHLCCQPRRPLWLNLISPNSLKRPDIWMQSSLQRWRDTRYESMHVNITTPRDNYHPIHALHGIHTSGSDPRSWCS